MCLFFPRHFPPFPPKKWFTVVHRCNTGGNTELSNVVANFYTMLAEQTSRLYTSGIFANYVSKARTKDATQDYGGPLFQQGSSTIRVRGVQGRGSIQGRHYIREGRRPIVKTDDVSLALYIVLDTKPKVNCDLHDLCHICNADATDKKGNVMCEEPYSTLENTHVTVTIKADGHSVRIISPRSPSSPSSSSSSSSSSAELMFTEENWFVPQKVVLKGIDDKSATIKQTGSIQLSAFSEDSSYDTLSGRSSITAASLFVLNEVATRHIHVLDNDKSGISLVSNADSSSSTTSTSSATVKEGAVTLVHHNVVLESKPISNVVLDVSSMFAPEGTLNTNELIFTPTNWAIPQVISVRSVNNNVVFNSNHPVYMNYFHLWSESKDLDYHQTAARYFEDSGGSSDGSAAVLAGGVVGLTVEEDDRAGLSISCGSSVADFSILLASKSK